jgi:hypothetical protein
MHSKQNVRRKWMLSQSQRRGLVVVAVATLAVVALSPWTGVGGVLMWGLLGAYVLLNAWLGWSIGFVDSFSDRFLDERQRGVRDRAHRLAYVVVSWYVLALLILMGRSPEVFGGDARALLLAAGLAVLVLPGWIIAWLEPDPPAEEVSRASNA